VESDEERTFKSTDLVVMLKYWVCKLKTVKKKIMCNLSNLQKWCTYYQIQAKELRLEPTFEVRQFIFDKYCQQRFEIRQFIFDK
jgi:hypothetical protein